MRRWIAVGAIGAVLALPVEAAGAGGGGGGGDHGNGGQSACPGYASGTSIEMRDNCFAGVAHFTDTGPVVVRNRGRTVHNLSAVDGTFATGPVYPGQDATLTFDRPGVFRIYCTLHATPTGQGMAGVVIVGEPVPPGTVLVSDTSGPAGDGVRFSSFTLGGVTAALCAGTLGAVRRRRRRAES